MSRIGREPISIPQGVEVSQNENIVTVKGPKGTLTLEHDAIITVAVENGKIVLTRPNEQKEVKAKHGLYRALIFNMVEGVTKGYEKTLIIAGVGYKATKQGNKIVLNLGYSHPIEVEPVEGVSIEVADVTKVVVSGIDKHKVGQVAANIRSLRLPEPYHGYGIHYSDEVIVRKEGKTAGK